MVGVGHSTSYRTENRVNATLKHQNLERVHVVRLMVIVALLMIIVNVLDVSTIVKVSARTFTFKHLPRFTRNKNSFRPLSKNRFDSNSSILIHVPYTLVDRGRISIIL